MVNGQGTATTALIARVRGILLRPKDEWGVIDGEKTDTATLYRSYVIPLAAIGPVASFIGSAVFGLSVPFLGAVRTPLANALAQAIVAYILALVGTYIVALVIDNLAPSFGGQRSMPQALKVAVYSSTPQWLVGIFGILPGLSLLSILGLYGLYLLYLGLPVLMKVPTERTLTYVVAVLVVAAVVFILVAAVSGAVVGTASVP